MTSGDSRLVLPTGSTVLFLPFPTAVDTRAMVWQQEDGLRWAMPGGYFTGPDCAGASCSGRAHVGPPPRPTSQLLAAIGTPAADEPQLTPEERERATIDFAAWHIDRVAVGPSPAQAKLVAAVTYLLGRSGTRIDDCFVWQIPSQRK